ncbi:MAG: alpha/beta fold hydrolase [Actinobacteria bacterium]|nr:MAG: alpha/beta fold hydrolase [Actinomycetota bacterium]
MLDHTLHVTVDGHRLAYHRSGSGEPLVLVHGITTYSFIWAEMIPMLEPHFDVIAIDLLGCGESDMPLDESYAIQDHAERLYGFLQALGLEKVHLVGHDLGGGITQIFAVRHPEMLYDLIMANTVAYDFWPVQPITALRTPIVRQLMMATFDLGTFRLVVKRGLYHKEKLTPQLMSDFMAPMQTSEGRKAFMHFARCLDNHNLTEIADDLRHLVLPVLIIRGDADPYLSSEIAESLHSEIPGSRLERIATASHFIQVDEPERIAELIIGFIGEHDA